MDETNSDREINFLAFLTLAFFVFLGYSFLPPFTHTIRADYRAVLAESTSYGEGSDSSGTGSTGINIAEPTPITEETSTNSGSGSTTSSSGGEPTPTFTTTSTSSDDSTITESINSGSDSTSSGSSTTDRLASVDSATLSCIKSRLTEAEIEILRYFVPENSEEEEKLKAVIEKAKVCFENYSETQNLNLATSYNDDFSKEVEDCLKAAVGEAAFNEINSGLREPTTLEKERGSMCFETQENEVRIQSSDEPLTDDTNKCLLLALGATRFRQVSSGRVQPTLSEREKAKRCFGVSTNPLKPRVTFKLPEKISSCMAAEVDSARLERLKKGEVAPTDTEKKIVNACFESINSIQKVILPPHPDQVAFLDEAPDEIEVSSSDAQEIEVSPLLMTVNRVFKGVGPANTVVDIFVFSDPIVVTTQTDENGEFSYTLTEPLTEGSHVAYATFKDTTGRSVRSAVYNFDVLAAETPQGALISEDQASDARSKFTTYAVTLMVVSLLFVLVGIFVMLGFRKSASGSSKLEENEIVAQNEKLGSTDGKGEGKGGSGTVN